jgi:protoporphyrinogen oxidase
MSCKQVRVGIIGGGVSGLSLARMLNRKFNVEILEEKSVVGGIARTKLVENVAYHVTGGHCFNSKYKDVLDFVFTTIMPKDQWHLVKRHAKIDFHDHLISYPIEFSVGEIAKFNMELAYQISCEMLSASHKNENQLDQWFISHFGPTLSSEYFIPYNKKIWNRSPSHMSSLWIKDKLPLPSKLDFFKSLIESKEDNMPHSSFYYPNSDNQNTFLEKMSEGVDISYDYSVSKVERKDGMWKVNDDKEYDVLINTTPLNNLYNYLDKVPDNIVKSFRSLKYNKVTTSLWTADIGDATWVYYPSSKTKFHRHIHIGNFFKNKKNYLIAEIVGEADKETLLAEGKKHKNLHSLVDYHTSDHAYVVFDENYNKSINSIRNYLSDIDLYTHGRFGEWEYYNMDICIKKSMELAQLLKSRYAL